MKFKLKILSFFVLIVLLTQTACTNQKAGNNLPVEDTSADSSQDSSLDSSPSETPTPSITPIDDTTLIEEFDVLTTTKDVKLTDVITFIKKNISLVTAENASAMMIRFEELQANNLIQVEELYYPEEIQKSFQDASVAGVDFNQPEALKDSVLMKFVQDTLGNGFKVEQAEGFYFPVIDYSIYKEFSSYVTPDIKAYIDIMSTESDQVFAKDAALVIGWDELVKRVLSQEDFLTSFGDSKKTDAVRALYERYGYIAMYGLNNTPLFDYETNTLNEEANTAYVNILKGDSNSAFLINLKGFMDVVKKNDYKLTDDVEEYRKNNTKSLTATDTDSNRYSVAGIENAAEFEEAFQDLQTFVANNDKKAVAEYIAYPINVTINGSKVEIKSEGEFVENYDNIMTEAVKTVFLKQKVDDTFVNYKGVMVGQGELWISSILDTKHKYSIYGINN